MTEDHNQETSLSLGSILDDNVFHEVMIARDKRDLVLSVDRVKIRDRIRGEFQKLDLDGYLYIGLGDGGGADDRDGQDGEDRARQRAP